MTVTVPGRWAGGERGSGTVLTAIGMMVLVAATVVGWWIVAWTDAAQQARRAADLAALAGAAAYAADRDPCAAARVIAAANRAVLVRCRISGDPQAFAVSVRVSVALHPVVTGGPRVVGADAVAGSGMR
ncbi:MAG: hypothetical protein M0Z51_10905 [Propionibacterium sp.]|nr:hypothetical protein [Propionibacterium sp.]